MKRPRIHLEYYRHLLLLASLLLVVASGFAGNFTNSRPNVLFIAVDDSRDWVSISGKI